MKDFDNSIQNQPNLTVGFANITVAQKHDTENRAAQLQHNLFHIMNNNGAMKKH